MKTLLLVRHAKSSWDNHELSDFDRPLNERGKKNAPDMAQRLKKLKVSIDAFLSSPAVRARKTAELFAEELDFPKKNITFLSELYHASQPVFEKVIEDAPDSAATIAVFSHNPGITDYANSLTDVRLDNMPTSSVFGVRADVNSWKAFADAEKTFVFFDYPKSIKSD